MRTEFTVTAIEGKKSKRPENHQHQKSCVSDLRGADTEIAVFLREIYICTSLMEIIAVGVSIWVHVHKVSVAYRCKHTGHCKKDDDLPPDKTPKQREGVASSKLSGILQVSTVTWQNLWVWLIQGDSSVQISLPVFSETILMKCLFTVQKLNSACRECLFCIYLSLVWKS